MNNLTEKGNFWSKVRSQTKNITTHIGSLSIRSEHDGDSEESTLIHKALVKHYQAGGRGYPEWLGVVEEQPPHQHQQPRQVQNPYMRHQVQPQAYQQGSNSQGQGSHSDQGHDQAPQRERFQPRRAASSFKDMYANNSNEGQSQQNDRSAAMRDRLKRNNYRNNFV